jgi:hypothetical protein
MSNFKEKNIKYSTFCQNVLKKSAIIHGTLDAKHNEIMKEFTKKKQNLPKLKLKLDMLKEDLESLNNPENYKKELIIKIEELENLDNKNNKNKKKNKNNQIANIINVNCTQIDDSIDVFLNVNENIEHLKSNLLMLTEQFQLNKLKNNINDEINELEEEIISIENNEDELNYLNDTSEILFKYYDTSIKEKQKIDMPNDLQDFFTKIKENKKSNNDDDKYHLFNKYMKITTNTELKKQLIINLKICNKCNIEKTLHLQEGYLTCTSCGDSEPIQMDSDKPNYKDSIIENKPNGYKRMNHFSELLNQCQGKESTDIPQDIFQKIINELNVLKITDLSKLDNKIMRKILKNLNLNSYYEHIPYIINKLNGIPPPTMSRELEEKIRSMFKEVQEPWVAGKKTSRKNFLNNNYVFHKIFELLEEDSFLEYFPYLKSREKLQEHDDEWKKICGHNKWQFIPSL